MSFENHGHGARSGNGAVLYRISGEGLAVHVFGDEEAKNEPAGALADRIVSLLNGSDELARAKHIAERTADLARRSQIVANRLREDLTRVLSGRRIRGSFLVQLDDRGGAWLQDPEKGDAGFGLYFKSLSDLWRAHPDLRPVEWADGRLICEPWSFE
jgi:hypothetical protein